MKIAFVCGSPKPKNSASAVALAQIRSLLSGQHTLVDVQIRTMEPASEALNAIKNCEAIVLAFPLYVDAIPGHLLASLLEYETMEKGAQLFYAVVNCGFYEGEQCRTAARILENWCKRAGLSYKGTVGLGTGGMLGMYHSFQGKGPLAAMRRELESFAGRIEAAASFEFLHTQSSFPRLAYQLAAHAGWRKQAKKNGLSRKDLRRRVLPGDATLKKFAVHDRVV